MFKFFIGCSHEAKELALLIKEIIENKYIEATIWDEPGCFNPPATIIEFINEQLPKYDGSIFLFTADDIRRNKQKKTVAAIPRDNIFFEFGLIYGRKGPDYAIPVVCREEKKPRIVLPSDFNGICYIEMNYRYNKGKLEITNLDAFKEKLSLNIDKVCQPVSSIQSFSIRDLTFHKAVEDDIYKIAEVAKYAYGPIELNDFNTKLAWYEKNNYCFWVVKDRLGQVRAHISILPIKRKAYMELRNGVIKEKQITKDDVYSLKERDQVKYLYIEGLCNKYPVNPTEFTDHYIERSQNKKALYYLFINVEKHIETLCNKDNIEAIGALGGSKSGIGFLEDFGFSLVMDSGSRSNHLGFYQASLDNILHRLKERLKKS